MSTQPAPLFRKNPDDLYRDAQEALNRLYLDHSTAKMENATMRNLIRLMAYGMTSELTDQQVAYIKDTVEKLKIFDY